MANEHMETRVTSLIVRETQIKTAGRCHLTPTGVATVRKAPEGVTVVAQPCGIRLGSMRTQVRSLVSLSGLRISCCCELWRRSQMCLPSGVAVAVVWGWQLRLPPPAGELPCAADAALKSKTKNLPEKSKCWGHVEKLEPCLLLVGM